MKWLLLPTQQKYGHLTGLRQPQTPVSLSFEEYKSYDDGTNKLYELVDGSLIEMPPISFLHSDIEVAEPIASMTFSQLKLTATEILEA